LATYEAIRREGTQRGMLGQMQTRDQLYHYLDYEGFERSLDRLFAAEKER
jgi:methylisocitrate lyase